MSVLEEFVDGPLVVSVLSVLDRGDATVGSDQEIRRQPKATSGGLDWSKHPALRGAAPDCSDLTGHRRAQRAPAQERSCSTLDAEPLVQLPFRVGDQRERQLGL